MSRLINRAYIAPLFVYCALVIVQTALLEPSVAAPDDRGPKGAILSVGGGGALLNGTGVEGEALAPAMGGSYLIGVREEVWPRLTLGLHIGGYMGSSELSKSLSLNGLILEGRWRFGEGLRGPVIMGGLGIGGGGLTDSEDADNDASGGGALWRVAFGYELGSGEPGFSVTPSLAYEQLRAQMDSKVSVGVVSVNLEVAWEIGR